MIETLKILVKNKMDSRSFENILESFKANSIRNTLTVVIVSFILWNILSGLTKWLWSRKKYPPGPIGFPILGSLPFLGSEPHKTLFGWRKKYGDVIGLYLGSRYTVFLNEYSVMKEVLSSPSSLDRAVQLFDYIPQFGFANANRESWVEQRKFSMASIKDLGVGKVYWEEVVKDEVQSFMNFLKNAQGKPVDISEALQESISSNIVSFLIGRKLDKKKEADIIELTLKFNHVFLQIASVAGITSVIPGLRKILELFNIGDFAKGVRIIKEFGNFVQKEILGHKNPSSSHAARDFLGVYLEELEKLRKSGKSNHWFSEAMLEGNVVALFIGASDTTYGSIIWLLRLMAKHPDVQRKVYAELSQSLEKDEKARFEERDKIPYTLAVLMEAQRFSGFVPLTAPRQAINDIEIKGIIIPKGADIVSNLWAIHHDPNYWEKPNEFIPDRFLIENGTKLVKSPPSFSPFSMGRRSCPGERIAWMEIVSYFTEIIRHFEVSTPFGVKLDFRVTTGIVKNLLPQELCFKARNDHV